MPAEPTTFESALQMFEAIDREDPRLEDGISESARYHAAVARWVAALRPDASVALQLAARCQHIRRWLVPRTEYPDGREGYKRWRSGLRTMHAAVARETLARAGFDDDEVSAVGSLVAKTRRRHDPEAATLEDAVCLTFLELGLEGFAAKHPPAKLDAILAKTWGKMSPAGRTAALALAPTLPPASRTALERALQQAPG